MNTPIPLRALLLALTVVLVPTAGYAQASDNQPSDSQASEPPQNYPTPDNDARSYPAPDNQAPNYPAPDNQTPNSPVPESQAPNYPAPDNPAPNYPTSDNQASNEEAPVASTPPPPLPSYEQPPVPGPGYLWTPGYWAYNIEGGYYWVPGTWVRPPFVGVLWTPGYWGWGGGLFIFHRGYWGPRVGFYGGINYGCGYFGVGFAGGYWHNREFFYNRAVTNIRNVSITNVYNRTVVNRGFADSRISHNGGPGGINLRATAAELATARAAHYGPTNEQRNHEWAAHTVPALRASINHGQPSIAATARPGIFPRTDRAVPGRSAEERSVRGSVGSQSRGASTNRVADRPPWASRGAARDTTRVTQAPRAQHSPESGALPAAGYRPGSGVRTGDSQHAPGNPRPPASRATYQAAVGSMHTAPPGYDYSRAARQPAAPRSAPPRAPAPNARYVQHDARGPTYAAAAPRPVRESMRAAPNPAASRPSANSSPNTRAGTQSAWHGTRHG